MGKSIRFYRYHFDRYDHDLRPIEELSVWIHEARHGQDKILHKSTWHLDCDSHKPSLINGSCDDSVYDSYGVASIFAYNLAYHQFAQQIEQVHRVENFPNYKFQYQHILGIPFPKSETISEIRIVLISHDFISDTPVKELEEDFDLLYKNPKTKSNDNRSLIEVIAAGEFEVEEQHFMSIVMKQSPIAIKVYGEGLLSYCRSHYQKSCLYVLRECRADVYTSFEDSSFYLELLKRRYSLGPQEYRPNYQHEIIAIIDNQNFEKLQIAREYFGDENIKQIIDEYYLYRVEPEFLKKVNWDVGFASRDN